MTEQLDLARTEIQRASEDAGSHVREQLLSLDEGLMELTEGDKMEGEGPPHEDRIAEVEEKLAGLERETDGDVSTRIAAARDHLDEFRRAEAE